jgi:hypothetical protein
LRAVRVVVLDLKPVADLEQHCDAALWRQRRRLLRQLRRLHQRRLAVDPQHLQDAQVKCRARDAHAVRTQDRPAIVIERSGRSLDALGRELVEAVQVHQLTEQ